MLTIPLPSIGPKVAYRTTTTIFTFYGTICRVERSFVSKAPPFLHTLMTGISAHDERDLYRLYLEIATTPPPFRKIFA